ncbi:L,D-transpeptidase family protein [Mesorhizobium sp. L-8-3]|uniref:L,D-transpeptidase family protein n=1 Tax=Mesorhizobium sp. L-8-3 TaxID=2744522 RepID=UPI001927560A|nr:L,D-transpeptidase [Mesorhizobium sp. L-8-3]BCH22765.1 murein L,D-transpeptidase [Mesorhizobium sp. L-8-3]
MFRRTILLSAVLAGAFGAEAGAAQPGALSPRRATPEAPRAEMLQLAQSGDVEIYYDGRGRRVLVDAFTGEILAIQEPRRQFSRERQRRMDRERELRRPGRYYLDDPDDMQRFLRDQGEFAPPVDDYGEFAPPADGDYSFEEFPPAPNDPYEEPPIVAYPSEPYDGTGILADRRIERQPLPDVPQWVEPGQPDETIFEPALPGSEPPPTNFTARSDVAGLQVLLDRAGASPGVIDGRFGSNVDKAIVAYRALTGENLKSTDAEGIKRALAATGGDPFTTYEITATDAAGPYVASVPNDYGEKAKLEQLSYTSVTEMLAERFHMDENYLKSLNPDANFNRPGTIIKVANVGANIAAPVARIVADKGRKQVRAYGADGKLVAAYPATIGSSDTPSPTGIHAVSRIAFNPEYTYNPKLNFKQGNNSRVLRIPPGPNGPVGSIWIALDKPTYGIHGTPDPSKIGKTESHGCVRLTNWDAQELAKIVKAGVPVEFVE